MMDKLSKTIRITNYSKETESLSTTLQEVITEQSVKLIVNGDLWISFICSPTDLKAMAVGFLWNEHIIDTLEEINEVNINPSNDLIEVMLKKPAQKPFLWHRTSTGLTIASEDKIQSIPDDFQIKAENLISIYETFSSKQALYESIGGYHSAAISDGENITICVEDVGRHNCMDKIAGLYLLDEKPCKARIILLTGRISSEMMHKALRLNSSLMVSRTTPTANAVEIAQAHGLTLIGYLRANRFTIYSHAERVVIHKN